MVDANLIQKYNVPGPRYTSYPTVPYWSETPTEENWKLHVKNAFDRSNLDQGISLYIHLPFCESLCTYCACNTRITINHAVEKPYIEALLKEWKMYRKVFQEIPVIREIHLGGGTPTFFSPTNLKYLLEEILKTSKVHTSHSFSFEAHPKNTSREHLETLFELGFDRLSLGIQDFDPKVQKAIHRIQPFDMVEKVIKDAREIGYTSINFDLIYGLPFQTKESIRDTIDKVNVLSPDRIAFYSYAHVPWIKPGQRSYTNSDLPEDDEKRRLYELGKTMFEGNEFVEIGMDHFAKKSDELNVSMNEGKLHRNFMGYTAYHTTLMVGLGCSSISDSWTAFVQNKKTVEDYQEAVGQGEFPFFRGHVLTAEDLSIRKHILNIMCRFETRFEDESFMEGLSDAAISQLTELESDQLIARSATAIEVKEEGKAFVRNICMALDKRMLAAKPDVPIFSKVI